MLIYSQLKSQYVHATNYALCFEKEKARLQSWLKTKEKPDEDITRNSDRYTYMESRDYSNKRMH